MSRHLSVLAAVLVLAAALCVGLASSVHAAPSSSGWQLPLPGSPRLLRPFDPPAEQWSAGHRGVDLAATPGTDVLAAGPGVVTFAGRVAGVGVVTVAHGDLRTTYQPVRATVRAGASVAAGDPIGVLGRGSHCGSRGCLHWGLLRGEDYLDPMSVLRPGRSRLVPVWGVSPGAAVTTPPAERRAVRTQGTPRARSTSDAPVRAAAKGGDGSRTAAVGGAAAVAATGAALAVWHRRRHRHRSAEVRRSGGRR
ncbi:MAG: peptidoglycan DD-metalloendopeptidase family protein [Streptosporangiales bacterium]|nr:peptidoglycan DD-metalloendopeptidase family protein [Streptosporangiales bacterium]